MKHGWTYALAVVTACGCMLSLAAPSLAQDSTTAPSSPKPRDVSDVDDGSPELTPEASKAIEQGLKWLLKTQKADGSWDDGRGNFQIASTSLALMAFMVKGEFPGYGPNAEALNKAKNWLLKQAVASSDGYLGKSMYEHGLATLALSELWGMTKDKDDDQEIQKALEAATQVILRSQNIGGGWRYQPSPDAGQDTSVTIMVFIALASARQAGVLVPDEAIRGVVRYLQGAQNPASGGFSYAPTGKGVSVACSGGGLYVAQLCGERDSQMVKAATNYLTNLPASVFANTGHYYYTHYYAIQAVVQTNDEVYAAWYPKIRDALIKKQHKDGYWAHGRGGATVSSTMAILILGTPHRFIPIYQR
jgi:hypothetical protein